MKLIPFVLCIVLVVTLTAPEDSEAAKISVKVPSLPPWAKEIAVSLSKKALKRITFAVCKVIDAPARCPPYAVGVGLNEGQAKKAAKIFETTPPQGKEECREYFEKDNCETYELCQNR